MCGAVLFSARLLFLGGSLKKNCPTGGQPGLGEVYSAPRGTGTCWGLGPLWWPSGDDFFGRRKCRRPAGLREPYMLDRHERLLSVKMGRGKRMKSSKLPHIPIRRTGRDTQ